MTHYLVPVSEQMLEEMSYWPPTEGFRLHRVLEDMWQPGIRLCEFDDDGAGPEFEGKIVQPVFQTEYDSLGHIVCHHVGAREIIG